jgi:hypothetical protein
VLALVIDKGIDTWDRPSSKNDGAVSACVLVCDAITKALGPFFEDPTLAAAPGTKAIRGRTVIRHYITAICDNRIDRHSVLRAATSDLAIRQAGLFAELFSKDLITFGFVKTWWETLNKGPLNGTNIRQFHAFLTVIGYAIDIPKAKAHADEFFQSLEGLCEGLPKSLIPVQPAIQVCFVDSRYH